MEFLPSERVEKRLLIDECIIGLGKCRGAVEGEDSLTKLCGRFVAGAG